MKILLIALLMSGLCACAGHHSAGNKNLKQEDCEMLEGAARESCLSDLERKQKRERDRYKSSVMCNGRLSC